MDNITDLPHLLAKASVTADPVPADPAGKGKQIAPVKNQSDVKLPSGSKRPSGMEDIDSDGDDELLPIPANLTGKSDPSSSNPPTWTADIDSSEDDDDLGEGYGGFRFDRLPGGRFRVEMQAPPGGRFLLQPQVSMGPFL